MIFTKEEAVEFFSEVFCGEHHIPGEVKEWFTGWAICMLDELSTYDFNVLTRMVFCAHDKHIRLEISPAMRYLRIAIHKRERDGGEKPLTHGHPTIDQAIKTWRERGHEERL